MWKRIHINSIYCIGMARVVTHHIVTSFLFFHLKSRVRWICHEWNGYAQFHIWVFRALPLFSLYLYPMYIHINYAKFTAFDSFSDKFLLKWKKTTQINQNLKMLDTISVSRLFFAKCYWVCDRWMDEYSGSFFKSYIQFQTPKIKSISNLYDL